MKAGTKLLLVGCGKMGGALLKRVASSVTCCVVEPSGIPTDYKSLSNISWHTTADTVDPSFQPHIIVLAIKPQQMASTLPDYKRYTQCVFLSIAAGVSLSVMEASLGGTQAIVRSMPNLPASIGQGMTVATANKNVTADQHDLCDQLLKAVGETAWIEDEQLIDAVTALSGSGPAYVFALCEAMAKAGEGLGLSATLAAKLARQTLIGSGALLAQSHESAEALRIAVTSPGGTTEAALKVLSANGSLTELIQKTMAAAFQRAKELAKLT